MKASNSGHPDVMEVLEEHYKLQAYGLDWRDGERTQHELWRMHPKRRFNSYAITSLYFLAAEFCPKNARVLDFGCATGFGTYLLAAKTKAQEILGIDLDEGAVRWGRQQYARPNLKLEVVDLHDPHLDNLMGEIDLVYCSNVMEHVSEYEKALNRIHDLIKPGGLYFHVTPPSGRSGGNPYHITNFKIPRWRKILEGSGFYNQRYFAHQPDVDRDEVKSEFDFSFVECGPEDMTPSSGLGSISGIILAQKSFNPNRKAFDAMVSTEA